MQNIIQRLGIAVIAAGTVMAGAPAVAQAQGLEGSFAPRVCEELEPCGSVDQLSTMSIQGLGISVEGLGICLAGSLCPAPGPTNPVSWILGTALHVIGSLDGVPQPPTQPLS